MANERCGPAEEGELVEILRQIASRAAAASLIVSDGVSERIFYFSIGGIRVIRSGPRKSATIGEMLCEMGRLDEEGVQAVLARCRVEKRLFGEIAVSLGLLTRDDVDLAIRAKVEEEILDIFLWDGAEYRLIEGQPPKEFYAGRFHAASLSCNVQVFVQSMLARLEDWRGVLGRLPTGREIYHIEPDADLSPFNGEEAELLWQFDGTRMAKDVISGADRRRTPAWDVVLRAISSGVLRRIVGHAAQSVKREQVVREIDALEHALPQAVDPRIVRARLARSCESVGERARAAGHWRALADGSRRRNELARALDGYRNAIRLLPSDFSAREIVLEIHRHNRDHGMLVADGRPLADLLVKHNLLNRAKLLLLQLVGIVPADAALRRQLVTVLIGLGEHDLALRHLRELADILEARQADDSELLDVYMRILAMDKRDKAARARIDALTGVGAQRRALAITIAASLVAFAFVGGAFAYESTARREVAAAYAECEARLADESLTDARVCLAGVIERFPYAWVTRDARTQLDAIVAEETSRGDRLKRLATSQGRAFTEAEVLEMKARQQLRETEAAALAADAQVLRAADDLVGAHAKLRELLDDYAESAAARAAKIPLEVHALPSDATITLNGEAVGRGLACLEYVPGAATVLRVEREGFDAREVALDRALDLRVDVSLEKGVVWEHVADAELESAPLVVDDVVYVAGRDRRLTALSLADGSTLWSRRLGLYGDAGVRPVLTAGGLVIGTGGGEVICLDPGDGTLRWSRGIGAPIEAQPFATRGEDGVIVVPGTDGRLAALSVIDGEERWSAPSDEIAPATAPRRLDDAVFAYAAAGSGLGIRASADGSMKVRPDATRPLTGSPSAEYGRIWATTAGDTVTMFSAATGDQRKSFPVPQVSPHAPLVVGDVAFVTCMDSRVVALRADGERVFERRLPAVAGATPGFVGGQLLVPCVDGRLYFLDGVTGEILWHFDAGAPLRATPVPAGDVVIVATSGGRVVAVRR